MEWNGVGERAPSARQATTDANLAVRNKLISQMDFGSGHSCEPAQTGGLSFKGEGGGASASSTNNNNNNNGGAVMPPAYPGEWVSRYKHYVPTEVASVQLNYMHMVGDRVHSSSNSNSNSNSIRSCICDCLIIEYPVHNRGRPLHSTPLHSTPLVLFAGGVVVRVVFETRYV